MKNGFSMIELIFVIVIIGILATIAIPKFNEPLKESRIYKASEEVSMIRAGIANVLNDNLMEGNNTCPVLEKNINDNYVFEGVLQKPIAKNANGIEWNTNDGKKYTLSINGISTTFEYDDNASNGCTFACNSADALCKDINKRLK